MPKQDLESRLKYIGPDVVKKLAKKLHQPVQPRFHRPISKIFYLLSELKGSSNYFYVDSEFIRGCVNFLKCGVDKIIEEITFTISNIIVEEELALYAFEESLIEQLLVLLHEKCSIPIIVNITYIFWNFCDVKVDKIMSEFILRYNLLEEMMVLLNEEDLSVRSNSLQVISRLIDFDCENELSIRFKIFDSDKFVLIRKICEEDGEEIYDLAQSIINKIEERGI